MRYIILDTETNTLDDAHKVVLQLAYIIYENGRILKAFSEYFYLPDGYNMDPGAAEVNGLFREKLAGIAKREFSEYLPEFFDVIRNCDAIVGHNVNFDINAIKLYQDYALNCCLDSLQVFDTCTSYLKYIGVLACGKKGYYYKFPSLDECVSMLLNSGSVMSEIKSVFRTVFTNISSNLHDAAFDVYLTLLLFNKLRSCEVV